MSIVKGLRAISDFEYELEMNQLNRQLASDIESVYLMASPQYSFLSSSGVKEIADLRWRRLRAGARGSGATLAGSARALTKQGAPWTSWY